jgi:molecular chaperone GrpE
MPDDFDAIAAAKELDDFLAEPGPSDEILKLEKEVETLKGEIAAATKRVTAASQRELESRTRKILEDFLPVVDDLDRGIVAARKVAESADVVEGLELIRRSMLSKLGGHGVRHAPALGEVFDPRRHEAIVVVQVTDRSKNGRVIDVMREGYQIGDETLRPAGVAVGKA